MIAGIARRAVRLVLRVVRMGRRSVAAVHRRVVRARRHVARLVARARKARRRPLRLRWKQVKTVLRTIRAPIGRGRRWFGGRRSVFRRWVVRTGRTAGRFVARLVARARKARRRTLRLLRKHSKPVLRTIRVPIRRGRRSFGRRWSVIRRPVVRAGRHVARVFVRLWRARRRPRRLLWKRTKPLLRTIRVPIKRGSGWLGRWVRKPIRRAMRWPSEFAIRESRRVGRAYRQSRAVWLRWYASVVYWLVSHSVRAYLATARGFIAAGALVVRRSAIVKQAAVRWYSEGLQSTSDVMRRIDGPAHSMIGLGAPQWRATPMSELLHRFGWALLSKLPRLPENAGTPKGYRSLIGIHLKEEGRSYEQSFKGRWGGLRYDMAQEQGQRKKKVLWQFYTHIAHDVRLDVPYVYVALHFQPERTTSSLGGVFGDQYLVVDMLARCLPAGWKIYVKEHPSQFNPAFAGERSRHTEFYLDLLTLPNVEIVSLMTSSFQLIDHARAVATVTGTVGLEAVIREKPTLMFGTGWYRFCEGVMHVATEAALRDALARIEAGYTPDPRKVRLYMRALDIACARSGLGYDTPEEREIALTVDESARRLTDTLRRYWHHMQRNPLPFTPTANPPWLAAEAEQTRAAERGPTLVER